MGTEPNITKKTKENYRSCQNINLKFKTSKMLHLRMTEKQIQIKDK